jgi:AcrR family transcriptional regulator
MNEFTCAMDKGEYVHFMTLKAERTRQRIVDAALQLFTTRGYAETTLRDIADAAGVSTGLAYRYFSRKEELVLVLYAELSEQAAAVELPEGSLGARWLALERARFAALSPHRETLLALVQAALDPEGELGILSPATAPIRDRWLALHRSVVDGAPPTALPPDVCARLLYALDLAIVVVWTQDRTPGAARTVAVLEHVASMVDAVLPFLAIPGVARALAAIESNLPLSPVDQGA